VFHAKQSLVTKVWPPSQVPSELPFIAGVVALTTQHWQVFPGVAGSTRNFSVIWLGSGPANTPRGCRGANWNASGCATPAFLFIFMLTIFMDALSF
jgi:hypothetical protein